MSVLVGPLTSLTPALSHRERVICGNANSSIQDLISDKSSVFVCPLSRWERAGVREDKPCLNATL
jgi:hypothetical protein